MLALRPFDQVLCASALPRQDRYFGVRRAASDHKPFQLLVVKYARCALGRGVTPSCHWYVVEGGDRVRQR